jgi:hypothetical protein
MYSLSRGQNKLAYPSRRSNFNYNRWCWILRIITIFEIYAGQDTYKAYLETPHFKKYKSTTREMVRSLELIETVPIALKAKPRSCRLAKSFL